MILYFIPPPTPLSSLQISRKLVQWNPAITKCDSTEKIGDYCRVFATAEILVVLG